MHDMSVAWPLMRSVWSKSALVVALALALHAASATAAERADVPLGPKPASLANRPDADTGGDQSAKKQVAKKRRKAASRSAARRTKKPRSNKPQKAPDPAVRSGTAGPGAPDIAPQDPDSPEIRTLRQAERELFGADDRESPSEGCPSELLADAGSAQVLASGLPPAANSLQPASTVAPPKLDYLSTLRMPDVPVRWSARVLQYLEFYKNDPRGRTIVAIWYRKSGRYEPMLRSVLRKHGLPEDLMWVAVVESGLRPTVYSPAGAAGLWQFMPETGRLYGLVVDRWVDERLDPVRSTHAAAMYLQDLHRRFGTWELALGSYNMGFGGMLSSIRKYNTNDFWELSRYEAGIPWETTLYVPKILALAVVAKNPEVFGLSNINRDAPAEFDEVDVVPGVSLEAVAKAAEVDVTDVEQLNPQLLAARVPPRAPHRAAAGVWRIRIPKGHAAKVDANLVKTRASERALEPYTVRHGESLADIARMFRTSSYELAQVNALRSDEVLRPGSVLMVPPERDRKAKRAQEDKPVIVLPVDLLPPPDHQRRFYQAVAGDTLEGVANALSVRSDELRRWNGLDPRARLHPGMSLMAIVSSSQNMANVRTLAEHDVRVLVVGTDAFFDHFEGLKGRARTATVVRAGEGWRDVSKRTGLSVGMLERINRRSRRDELQAGERLVVYLPASRVAARPKPDTDEEEGTGRAPIEASDPENLPAVPSEASPAPARPAVESEDTEATS
jgi:peptidoglycan lytic transglycosylase D